MTSLAFISLAAPWMLTGLGLLSLPIAAHLLHRRARRHVQFPTLALLAAASATQSSLFRLRRLLLLLLRCLAVLLIVLAFTGPAWLAPGVASPTADMASGIVVVLDASASSGQLIDGVPLMQNLRAAAARALDAAQGPDVANVIYAGARPRPAHPVPTRSLAALRADLAGSTPTPERADLPAAIARAGEMLATVQGVRSLVIVSDLQATNWSDTAPILAAAAALPAGTRITVVPIRGDAPGNASVQFASVTPEHPVIGRPVRVVARVANFSALERTTRLALLVDGVESQSREIHLDAHQHGEAVFPVVFSRPGPHTLTLAIPDDALAADNRAYAAVDVVERPTVLLIGDDDALSPQAEGYYLLRALSPEGNAHDAPAARRLTARQATDTRWEEAAAVVVAGAGDMSDQLLHRLHDYMKGGGGVLFLCGSASSAGNLQKLDALDKSGVTPFMPTTRRLIAPDAPPDTIGDADWSSDLLRPFDPVGQRQFSRIRFTRTWQTTKPRDGSTVWMRFSDGRPALAAIAVGDGRCIVANFGVSPADGDVAKHAPFVALLHGLVAQASRRWTQEQSPLVGDPLSLGYSAPAAAAGDDPRVFDPDGGPIPEAGSIIQSGHALSSIGSADKPGMYTVRSGDQTLAMRAVNVDPRESDLRRADPAELDRALRAGGSGIEVRAGEEAMSPPLRGEPLWGWAILAAMAVLAAEMLVQVRWAR
ncbi:MAG: BatA domain-containing protein [Planctomycetes bacterium]|nr:BatA domain-containing protein [Planctomycetota bacterium]